MAEPYEITQANTAAYLDWLRKERLRLGRVRERIQDSLSALATEARNIFGFEQPEPVGDQPIFQLFAHTEDQDPVTGQFFSAVFVEYQRGERRPSVVRLTVGDRDLVFTVTRDGQLYVFANDITGNMRIALVPRNASRSLESVLRISVVGGPEGKPHTSLILEGSTAEATFRIPLIDLIAQILDESAQRAKSLAERIEIRTDGYVSQ